ncbi:MAG: adenylyl-sulfate kinase [Thermodesulfobacteriota bacterium]
MEASRGFCVWFTGLKASGKTTLAGLLREALQGLGFRVEVLDGQEARRNLSPGLGFRRKDREAHLRRVAYVAELLVRHGVVAAITPYESVRQEVRTMVGDLVEVFLDCPLDVCLERDHQGMYKKALAGEVPRFTGVSDPFEPPAFPDVLIPTQKESPAESLARLLRALDVLGRVPPSEVEAFTDEEKEMIKRRLTDLGYM